MSVDFTPSPGQPLCLTSIETRETIRVGTEGDEDFFAFGEEGEEGEEGDFLERGEGDFAEEEGERRRVFTDAPPPEAAHSFLYISKKIYSSPPLRIRNDPSSP